MCIWVPFQILSIQISVFRFLVFWILKNGLIQILKKGVGFESDPPESAWVWVLTEIIKLFDSTRVFYIQTTQAYQK